MAVKDTCYASPEISHLTSTSERDAFLAKVVSACIKEYFRGDGTGEVSHNGKVDAKLDGAG